MSATRSHRQAPPFARSRSASTSRSSPTCAGASRRPGGPSARRSTTTRRACRSRPCRSSRATGRPSYDWRRCEARLNALPNFLTEIDGLDIHFIHVRSRHEDALPLIVTHGWPGSIVEQLKIIEPLTDPTAHGGSEADAFHVVIPSLPGHGFSAQAGRHRLGSDAHRTRLGGADEPPRLHRVRGAGGRLGRGRHAGHGHPGARRGCSASTPTCPARPRPTSSRGSRPASRRRPASPTRSCARTSS